jgi:hypothetical protein
LLIGSGGGRSVADGRALMATLERWLEPGAAAARVGAGEQARALVEAGLGAADRAVELVEGLLRHERLR